MAEIRSFGPIRHLRADASSVVLHYRNASLKRTGRGLAFWFTPYASSVAEIPVDDREVQLTFHGRSSDFQDIMVQGILTYRVVEPVRTAGRVDFSIDLRRGALLRQPLERIALMLSQLAQQHALGHIQRTPVRELLAAGHERIRAAVEQALAGEPSIAELGLEVASVRVSSIRPAPELEKAMEAPVREHIQEEADEAAFRRRAAAVEKERAIQENELQNRIELARREEQLIEQQGANERREATDKVEAARIASDGEAQRIRTRAEADAGSVRAVEGARAAVERERMDALRTVPPAVLAAMAAQELAGKLKRIDHLNITPDLLAPLLAGLAEAAQRKLSGGGGGEAALG